MKSTQKITQGAVILAVYIVLYMLFNLSYLSGIISLCLPIPFIIFAAKQQDFIDLIWLFICTCLTVYLIGAIFGVMVTLIYGVNGVLSALFLKRKVNKLLFVPIIALIFMVCWILFSDLFVGISINVLLSNAVHGLLVGISNFIDITDSTVSYLLELSNKLGLFILFIMGVMTTVVSQQMSVTILERLR